MGHPDLYGVIWGTMLQSLISNWQKCVFQRTVGRFGPIGFRQGVRSIWKRSREKMVSLIKIHGELVIKYLFEASFLGVPLWEENEIFHIRTNVDEMARDTGWIAIIGYSGEKVWIMFWGGETHICQYFSDHILPVLWEPAHTIECFLQ